jgi:hypothetical protein
VSSGVAEVLEIVGSNPDSATMRSFRFNNFREPRNDPN